ncbi:MAG: outer membrane lipoprotein-sorting protein [Thermodesulfobacteriota bacterium]|nr:outer membrane lipoprotein-sorting protein [Thermodesulfobacteriota bacterium]
MINKVILTIALALFIVVCLCIDSPAKDARTIVKQGFDYMRGKSSISVVDMTIHRPNWERKMTIEAWTKGLKNSLFRIVAPAKDKDNGTLKRGKEMWMYNPKVNRVIKLPPSMMSQPWMGSDFSNNDLSKTDSLIDDYNHTITGTQIHDGKTVYLIKSVPKPDAPVVWGMQKLKIREDHVFLAQEFYDEDLKLVKHMTTLQIQMLGGKMFPKVWRMQKAEVTDEYTELNYKKLSFKENLKNTLFTISNLKNPRR